MTIIFRGKLSKSVQKHVNRAQRKSQLIFTAVISVLAIAPITYAAVCINPLWAITAVCIPILFLACFLPIPKIYQKDFFPTEISIIDTDVHITGESFYHVQDTDNIKTIIDYGNCYQILFEHDKTFNCLCQKDLIVEGTIEEFEARFADLIVRKAN